MNLSFHTLDVFTTTPFTGNPLAVVLGGDGLDTARMQAIAREFNLSETVFVAPARTPGALASLRIFTPAAELPFAGHPTVGTAVLLAELGMTPHGDEVRIVLDEGVGPVPVLLRKRPGELVFAQLTAAVAPEFGPAPAAEALAAVLGLERRDIADTLGGPMMASTGVRFLLVPVRDPAALQRARPRPELWAQTLAGAAAQQIYLYCQAAAQPQAPIRARMFALDLGIGEDPATGSAAAALCAALASRETVDGVYRWNVEQGYEMGRPSQLALEAERVQGQLGAVRVGGYAIAVSQGRMLSF